MTNKETLEEAAEKYANDWEEIHPELSSEDMTPIAISKLDFIEGAKWQQEQMYSEEDMKKAFEAGKKGYMRGSYLTQEYYFTWNNFKSWFEQFKKK